MLGLSHHALLLPPGSVHPPAAPGGGRVLMQAGDWGGRTSEEWYHGHHSCDVETSSLAFVETFPVLGKMRGTKIQGCEKSLFLVWDIYLFLCLGLGSSNYLSVRTL